MNEITLLERCYEHLTKVVGGMRPDQLDAPTPNPGWDVRTLLNHVYGCSPMFVAASRGEAVSHDDPDGDVIGDDPAATLAGLVTENLAAWRRPGALETMCPLPPGTMPGAMAIRMNAVEVLLHGWDLAVAIGGDTALDEEVSADLLAFVGTLPIEDFRAMGALGPEVAVAADAPAGHRLLGVSGRRP